MSCSECRRSDALEYHCLSPYFLVAEERAPIVLRHFF